MNDKKQYLFEVIVGNIGTVHHAYEGAHGNKARKEFNEYVKLSKQGFERVAHEDVTLLRDGEPVKEHHGTQNKEPEA